MDGLITAVTSNRGPTAVAPFTHLVGILSLDTLRDQTTSVGHEEPAVDIEGLAGPRKLVVRCRSVIE